MGNNKSKLNKLKFTNLPEKNNDNEEKRSQTINTKIDKEINDPSKI